MCRLRIPNGIMKHWQFAGMADLAERSVRTVLPRHHPRQPAGARNSAEERGGADRGHSGSRPVLARLRRRQHPQRHGHADGGHRSAGIARHPRICPRMALPHPQRPLADRTAAQIQRRLRRRRQDRGAGGHQRHRLCGGRGEGRFWCRARRLVSPRASAASPATRILPEIPASSSSRRTRPKSSDAIVRVFIDLGDRTNRLKARLKYVIDGMGMEKFLAAGRGKARPRLHARAVGSPGAASGIRPHGAYRRAQAEAGRA